MNKLSVAIITKNEEKNISKCLDSLTFADEIIVVDSGSTDKTVDICRERGCKVIISEWLGFGRTKKLAVDSCSNDWILSIDADEVITEELQKKILLILKNPEYSGYRIKRKSFYLGKMINNCGWNKDFPLRLFNRQSGNFNDSLVHEKVIISGEIGTIHEYMLHYTYPEIEDHVKKMTGYAFLGAKQLHLKGKKSSIANAVMHGITKFIKMYLLQKGFLDGKNGFILSLTSSFGVYLKYIKLWELSRSEK